MENNQQRILSRIRTNLVRDLSNRFRTDSISDLHLVSQFIEEFLRQYLQRVLTEESPYVLHGATHNAHFHEIEIAGRVYEVRVGEDTRRSDIVEVALVQCQPKERRSQQNHRSIKLPQHGRYQRASLWLPKDAQLDCDWFSAVTFAVFESGYRWFEEQVHQVITSAALSIGATLYSCLRPVIPDESLLHSIWFGVGTKETSFFLLDSQPAESALAILSSAAPSLGRSPYILLTELLSTNVPIDQTFSRIAVGEWQCRDFDLRESKYKDNMPLMARAEMEVLGPDYMSIFPVAKNGKAYLVAVFPTNKKELLLGVLEEHRETL